MRAAQGPLRLAIFDVDGTLMDSRRSITAAMRAAFAEAGYVPPDDAATLSVVGLSLPEAMVQLRPASTVAETLGLVEGYKAAFLRLRRETGAEGAAPLYPGARAALEALAGQGVLLGVATGKARRGLDHALAAHGLGHLFDVCQTADDAPSKPAPGMVLNCLAAAGVAPGDAAVVGDTRFDVGMARAAGVRAVGVSWGYHPAAALAAAGAEAVIDDFAALVPALARLWAGPA